MVWPVTDAPDMRHGAQLRAQGIGLHQAPTVQPVRALQELTAELMKSLLHWVKGLRCAGQDRVLCKAGKSRAVIVRRPQPAGRAAQQLRTGPVTHRQGLYRHAVLRDGAGLVGA